jgi:hypothetical protein
LSGNFRCQKTIILIVSADEIPGFGLCADMQCVQAEAQAQAEAE